jgi:hypothetical protein
MAVYQEREMSEKTPLDSWPGAAAQWANGVPLREFFAPVLEACKNRFCPKKKPEEGP